MKAAVIGLGPHGRRIVEVIGQMPAVELAAVVDLRDDALAAECIPAATARYKSIDELWARGDISLVCVATNGPSHKDLSLAAIKAGARWLMVEKPMACSLAECDAIAEAARATGASVAVDHVRRYSPAYDWVRQRMASGDWGKPRAIWMQRPGIGLGCLATHSFDTVCFLLGRTARRVTGWVDPPRGKNPRGEQFTDPGGMIVMEFDDEIRAVVTQIEDGAGPSCVEIDMTAARVRIDEKSGHIEIFERDLSVKPGPGRPPVFRQAEPPAGLTANTPMPVMIRGCLESLVADPKIIREGVHGRHAVEILVATYISHRRGNVPVELPLTNEEDLELWLPVT